MLRRLILVASIVIFAVSHSAAAIWPERIDRFTRKSAKPVSFPDSPIWEEYGFEEGEKAEYAAEDGGFTATAYRFGDATSAMAVYQWRQPPDAKPSELETLPEVETLAVETPDGAYLAYGNYLLHFEGRKPVIEDLQLLFLVLPRLERSALPTLTGFLPERGRISGSERYVIGPASLEEFEPRVPPSVAGFHFGVEAQLAKFETPKGEMNLAIFSYPTPQIARERFVEFGQLPGAVVKRSGPLLALILEPPDADEAEKLLAMVNYRANITWSEGTKSEAAALADLLLTIFALIGILLAFAILAGLMFGAIRFLSRRRYGDSRGDDPMILLHLDDR